MTPEQQYQHLQAVHTHTALRAAELEAIVREQAQMIARLQQRVTEMEAQIQSAAPVDATAPDNVTPLVPAPMREPGA